MLYSDLIACLDSTRVSRVADLFQSVSGFPAFVPRWKRKEAKGEIRPPLDGSMVTFVARVLWSGQDAIVRVTQTDGRRRWYTDQRVSSL